MIKKIKNLVMAAILPLAMSVPMVVATPAVVFAACTNTQTKIAEGASGALGSTAANCNVGGSGSGSLADIASGIVNLLSILIGIVAVIMIIFAGFRYITSGGDSGNVSNAKNTLIYAIIGLVIVALAQFIVRFVLTETGKL